MRFHDFVLGYTTLHYACIPLRNGCVGKFFVVLGESSFGVPTLNRSKISCNKRFCEKNRALSLELGNTRGILTYLEPQNNVLLNKFVKGAY